MIDTGVASVNSTPRPGWTLVLTSLAFFMVSLDALVVITALPAIQRDLSASLSTLQWTVNAYTLAYAAGIASAAALGDRFGRRRLFALGLGLFALTSAACAVAPGAELLIAARVLQGLGAAIIMPLSLTILTSAFPPERRGAMVGLWGGIAGLAVAIGPLVGGALTQGLNWHWIFWLNVPIGLISALLATRLVAESYGSRARLDFPGALLVSAGAVGTVLGLVRASTLGWGSPTTAITLSLGLVAMAGFVVREQRAPEPMLPLHLFASATFSAANLTGFFMSGSLFAAAFLVAQYMQLALGYSPLESGLRVLPWTAAPLIVAPLAGALSDRVGRRPIIAAGLALQAAGFSAFALLAGTGTSYWLAILPLAIAGVGVSMALPVVPATVLSAVASPDMGKAAAVNSTLQRFGAAFGVAVASAVFAANGSLAGATAFTAGFRPALLIIAGLSAAGVVSALMVGSGMRPVATESEPTMPALEAA
ncbi:MAG: DHA2 family efflux MFS transporter permease subunit [Chloroflexi bacterium]|nr:DHA2 family efflux MFS transporter permease subunit [Chloroflexota bacterium]